MLLYAGYKECTVRLFAGMPFCYIYSQQEGRQPSCPMAGRKNHEHTVRHHPQEPRPQLEEESDEETIATFYRHWDGYPSCHAIDIANSLVVASRTKPEQHIDFSGASVERNILNNRNWCQHFLKAMCMVDADIEFIGEDNVPSASYTYVVTGAYDNFGGKDSIGAEEYLSRINIKVYEGDENGNLVFEGGAAECLAWADGYCGDC